MNILWPKLYILLDRLQADIIGNSNAVKSTKENALRMARTDASILIYGESGTGKELFAQAIHNASKRSGNPFVAINCAALPESILESELFGYEEGAFTGARKGGKLGLFEMAQKGTLFLDEIGELPLKLQSRLLRVIQEKEIMRLGGDYLIDVDVRIISATNRDLWHMSSEGIFRNDLYYRLNVLNLALPPLRQRSEDIIILLKSFIKEIDGREEVLFTVDAEQAICRYNWEGNIRELYNCAESICCLSKEQIGVEDLPSYVLEMRKKAGRDNELCKTIHHLDVPEAVNEERMVLAIIYEAYSNKMRIGRRMIYQKLNEHGLMLSENRIRNIINLLDYKGLVKIKTGRAGTIITKAGIEFMNKRD